MGWVYAMKYDEGYMRQLFNSRDLSNGLDYVRRRRIRNYRETWEDDNFAIDCNVQGTRLYEVHIKVNPMFFGWRWVGTCDCPQFD